MYERKNRESVRRALNTKGHEHGICRPLALRRQPRSQDIALPRREPIPTSACVGAKLAHRFLSRPLLWTRLAVASEVRGRCEQLDATIASECEDDLPPTDAGEKTVGSCYVANADIRQLTEALRFIVFHYTAV